MDDSTIPSHVRNTLHYDLTTIFRYQTLPPRAKILIPQGVQVAFCLYLDPTEGGASEPLQVPDMYHIYHIPYTIYRIPHTIYHILYTMYCRAYVTYHTVAWTLWERVTNSHQAARAMDLNKLWCCIDPMGPCSYM